MHALNESATRDARTPATTSPGARLHLGGTADAPLLSVVIPALNEQESIGATIQRCLDAREHIRRVGRVRDVQIVVVSDGSTDRTAAIARSFADREPTAVGVIVFEKNRGYGAAIKAGFARSHGDLVAFLDADGTCDPMVFGELCSALQDEDAAIALGSRMGPGTRMPPMRRLGNRVYALLLGSLSGQAVSDTASGMRVWAFWLPSQAMAVVLPDRTETLPWQFGLTVVAVIALALAVRTYGAEGVTLSRDPRVLSLGLLVAIPGMLFGCMLFGRYDYVGDVRYYWSVIPLSIFVVYSVAATSHSWNRSPAGALLQIGGRLYLAGYVGMTLVYMAFLLTPSRTGTSQRFKLMAGDVLAWPSFAVSHELSPARRLVMRRLEENRNAILLTSRPVAFVWDPVIDGSRLHDLDCDISSRRVTGPAHIVILSFDIGEPHELWDFGGMELKQGIMPAHCFDPLPGLHMVQHFPDEGLKVLEASVPAGQQIALTR